MSIVKKVKSISCYYKNKFNLDEGTLGTTMAFMSGSFPDTVVPVKQKIRSIRRHISLFQIGQQICRCRKPPQLKS
jgi:hypothetical protein